MSETIKLGRKPTKTKIEVVTPRINQASAARHRQPPLSPRLSQSPSLSPRSLKRLRPRIDVCPRWRAAMSARPALRRRSGKLVGTSRSPPSGCGQLLGPKDRRCAGAADHAVATNATGKTRAKREREVSYQVRGNRRSTRIGGDSTQRSGRTNTISALYRAKRSQTQPDHSKQLWHTQRREKKEFRQGVCAQNRLKLGYLL